MFAAAGVGEHLHTKLDANADYLSASVPSRCKGEAWQDWLGPPRCLMESWRGELKPHSSTTGEYDALTRHCYWTYVVKIDKRMSEA